jgi:hypothetical protein
MSKERDCFTDTEIEQSVIEPSGGLSAFHLLVCPGYKLIKWVHDGVVSTLIIENDALYEATVNYLERAGVPQKPCRE